MPSDDQLIPDDPSTIQLFDEIFIKLLQITGLSRGTWKIFGRSLEQEEAGEVWSLLRELKPCINRESPLFRTLKTILGPLLQAGFEESLSDFSNLALEEDNLYGRVSAHGEELDELERLIKEAKPIGDPRAITQAPPIQTPVMEALPETTASAEPVVASQDKKADRPEAVKSEPAWAKHSTGKILIGWHALLEPIKVDPTEANQKLIKRYQKKYTGPITWLENKPRADEGALLAWWRELNSGASAAETQVEGRAASIKAVDNVHEQRASGLHEEKRPNSRGQLK